MLSVTILFTVLMCDTLHGFIFSVDACHYLPNVTNKKQRNNHRAVYNAVQTFHTRCPTVSYQCTFRYHLYLPLPFPVPSKVTTSTFYLSKILIHVGCEVLFHCCSSPVVVAAVVVVVVVAVVVVAVVVVLVALVVVVALVIMEVVVVLLLFWWLWWL